MTVLHVISSGGMYGAEAVILNLSAELNAGGRHSSVVAVFSHDPQQPPQLHTAAIAAGLHSELILCRGQMDRSVPGAIRALANGVGADVIHAHGYKADIYCFFAFRGPHSPALVSTCHTWYDNDWALRAYGAADRWVLRHYDEVIAVSPEVQQRLSRAGVPAGKIHLIRNGILLAPFAGVPEARFRRIDQERPLTVGLVGRLAPEKGVDLFIRTVALLADVAPEVHFVVAGDGPDRMSLEALIAEVGMQAKVVLAGQQQSMVAFYASLDVLVSASRQEGLPMALLEGMASGLPVVATAVGAVPEVVIDGETGFLVPPGTPTALANALLRLVRDPALREAFGEAGRRRIEQEFSAQRMTAEYIEVYERALARHPVSAPVSLGKPA